jgi:hypothetical protein
MVDGSLRKRALSHAINAVIARTMDITSGKAILPAVDAALGESASTTGAG